MLCPSLPLESNLSGAEADVQETPFSQRLPSRVSEAFHLPDAGISIYRQSALHDILPILPHISGIS